MIEDLHITPREHYDVDVGMIVRLPSLNTARDLLDQVAIRVGLSAVERGRIGTAMSELFYATLASSAGRSADEIHIRYLVGDEAMFVHVRSRSRDVEPVDPDSSSLAVVAALMDGFEVADDGTAIIRKDLRGD